MILLEQCVVECRKSKLVHLSSIGIPGKDKRSLGLENGEYPVMW